MGGSNSKGKPLSTPLQHDSPVLDTGSIAQLGGSGGVACSRPSEDDVKHVGVENYGNTCYCNSVIQTLYHCRALRLRLLELGSGNRKLPTEGVLSRLCELVATMHTAKKKKWCLGPSNFVREVRRSNPVFDNNFQHDAHEFIMYVLTTIIDEERAFLSLEPTVLTPIERIFGGQTWTHVYCLDCETKSCSKQTFLDLTAQLEPNTSLNHCLDQTWNPEYFIADNKIYCEACCAFACARRCSGLSKAPGDALLVHMKRFKFVEAEQLSKKLPFHVALPSEMGLKGDGAPPVPFRLKGFVVHQGAGANLGHYIGCFRTGSRWRRYDDDAVTEISERDIQQYFGEPMYEDKVLSATTAYIVLYEREEDGGC